MKHFYQVKNCKLQGKSIFLPEKQIAGLFHGNCKNPRQNPLTIIGIPPAILADFKNP